jgi:hypothetical protein
MESTVSDRSARWRGLLARQSSSGLSNRCVLPARGCGPLHVSLVEAEARRSRQTGCPCFVTVTLVTTSHGEAEMAKVSEDDIFDLGVGRQRQDGAGRSCRFSGVSPRRGGWDGPTALLIGLNADTWAVGPGWYDSGPLALGERGREGCRVRVGVIPGRWPPGNNWPRRCHVQVGMVSGGWPFGNKWPERCDVPIHGPSGCIAAAVLIRDNSCHSWFHPRTAPHLTAFARK